MGLSPRPGAANASDALAAPAQRLRVRAAGRIGQPGGRTRTPLPRPVRMLIGGLLATGLLIDLLVVHPSVGALLRDPLPFVIAMLAFGIAEAVVLHVELGRNTHSVSLAELALVVSLFFVPSLGLPLARVLGGLSVLLFVRRQRLGKAIFNASVWVVDTAVATAVFHQMGGGLQQGTFALIVPAIVAALAAATVDSIAVSTVISLTSREIEPLGALRFLGTCLVSATACSTVGVVCVGALSASGWLLVPISLILALLLVGFHFFSALRSQHANVKVLYEFTDALARASHGQAVIETLLELVATLLRAEQVHLYLADGAEWLEVSSRVGEEPVRTRHLPARRAPRLVQAMLGGGAPLVVKAGQTGRDIDQLLAHYQASDAVLAPLSSSRKVSGALVITGRLGDVSTFSQHDGLLLQTLATHASTALANSRLVQQLDHDSSHDSLTGLANRAYFQQRLDRALDHARSVGVLLMDLDRFKEVNDTLGHHHGDLLLQEIAGRLTGALRSGDLLARLGGDEFAVLVTDVVEDEIIATADRLSAVLTEPMQLQDVAVEVTGSIGVVLVAPGLESVTATSVMQRADVAMYAAKQQGKSFQVYEQDLDGHSPRRLALAGGLRAAIEDGQMSLRYQPQARLPHVTVIGAEALVRWEHPVFGEVSPVDFIDIAEQTGQIRQLTRFVLAAAVQDCASWTAAGRDMSVSVNVSVRNLLEADLVPMVAGLLAEHGLPGNLLTLEITETHLMADPARTREALIGLAELGVRLSVDDFGTGYSSLSYLKQLPVAELKIDRAFVRDLGNDSSDAAIVEAIVQLAHTMGLEVVAEGVEDAASQTRLSQLGCDIMQGYHLARPMLASELMLWLNENAQTTRLRSLRALPAQGRRIDAALA